MKKLLVLVVSVLLTLADTPDDSSRHFSLQLLKPGVWAAISRDPGGYAVSNAGIIDLGDKTVVFDAFISPEAAADLKKAAERLTHHPVSFVVNSHYHDDHIRGDQVFAPAAEIISTAWTRNAILQSEPEEQATARADVPAAIARTKEQLQTANDKDRTELERWLSYYTAIERSLPILKTIPPDIGFTDSMWLYGSKRKAMLLECRNGHTPSDAVLMLPGDGIAFMGDLLFVDSHPWMGDGDPGSWVKWLQAFLGDSAITIYVPGHGPVTGRAGVDSMIGYITDIERLVQDDIKNQQTDSEIVQSPVPAAYRDWRYTRFYPENLGYICTRVRRAEQEKGR